MADPSQVVGTPALNPPPPNEPGWLADTPQSTDNYDVVIGGLGLLLYRGEDDGPPDRKFKTEPVDSQFDPTFVPRTNISGDFGDDQQAFYMTAVQRDWSGGLGQKYFRKDVDPQDRMYWDGKRLSSTAIPGEVRLGGADSVHAATNANGMVQGCYINSISGGGSGYTAGALVRFDSDGSSKVDYRYSLDGGATWNLQATTATSATSPTKDMVDLAVGDDNSIYILQANVVSGSTSRIFKVGAPDTRGNTLTWDNSTGVTDSGSNPGCNCLCYWNHNLYTGDLTGKLRQVAFGTVSAQTIIKDFGGGVIIQLLPTPRGIYVLYMNTNSQYRIFLYDGTASVQEVARLPNGWRLPWSVERQFGFVSGTPASWPPSSLHCMCFLDGVLYVTGMLPARSYAESYAGSTPYRTALWYYASGNSGIVWASETANAHAYACGGSGACEVAKNGLVVFPDMMNGRIMAYDPGTAGIEPLGVITSLSTTTSATTITVNGTINSLATSLVTSPASGSYMLMPGSVISASGTGELALVIGPTQGGSVTQLDIIRGYQGTTPADATFVNGHTITVVPPMPFVHRLAYDPFNEKLFIPWFPVPNSQASDETFFYGPIWFQNAYSIIDLRPGPDFGGAVSGTLATSRFDFDSSLDKFFKDVVWDGDTTQLPNLSTEKAGTVDLYYKLNGTAGTTTDAGVVLVQAGATPGARYPINATGRDICIVAVLNAAAGSGSKPISQGPILRRISLRAVPIAQGYRHRSYQFALFSEMRTKGGYLEPRTPAQIKRALETMIVAPSTVQVSDSAMTSVTCAFIAESCTFREMKPDEWIAYVEVREV